MRRILRFIMVIMLPLSLIFLCSCANSGQTETVSPPIVPPAQTERPSATPDASSIPTLQTDDDGSSSAPGIPSGEVIVTFDYEKQSGSASNQYAVWIEDMNGNYINTLFATKWTAAGGYKSRPDSIVLWVEKSSISSMPDYYVDAISGATPRASGSQSYSWNLQDINGNTVPPGVYKFFVEGTLRWKNYVLYTGVITIGDAPDAIQADADFVYEASDRQAALTSDSPENAMIGAVTVIFVPAADN